MSDLSSAQLADMLRRHEATLAVLKVAVARLTAKATDDVRTAVIMELEDIARDAHRLALRPLDFALEVVAEYLESQIAEFTGLVDKMVKAPPSKEEPQAQA